MILPPNNRHNNGTNFLTSHFQNISKIKMATIGFVVSSENTSEGFVVRRGPA